LVGSPTTKPCVENIVEDYAFKNTAYGPDENFSGRYQPPKRCPGPWARVVATISVHVTGVQFDRLGDIRLGDTDVFAYSTAEPRGDGAGDVTWTKSKDITDYTYLLMHRQKLSFEIGNVVTGPYDGIFYGSLRLSFYPVDSDNPVPAHTPDRVLPVIREAALSSDTPVAEGEIAVPRDTTSLTADLLVQGHGGCDEFWWADAPPPFPGQCGTPPYREAQVFVDGTLAGIVSPYPYLFTGANGPNWWEPISAPQAMNLRPWRLDLTPFVGMLSDGAKHTLSVSMLDWSAQSGNDFRVNLALLADTSGQGATTGALTSSRAVRHAQIVQEVSATSYHMSAHHQLVTTGWYQVPGGPKVTTRVRQTIDAASRQGSTSGIFDSYDFSQLVHQRTAGDGAKSTLAVSRDGHHARLVNDAAGWVVADDTTSVATRNGRVVAATQRADSMTSKRESGAYVSREVWSWADLSGACGTTRVAGDNGVITKDVETARCVWAPTGLPPSG